MKADIWLPIGMPTRAAIGIIEIITERIHKALMNFISHRFVQAILKLHYKTLFILPEYYQSASSVFSLYLF